MFLAGNDASRFAQIEAFVDHGHAYINESRFHWTVDRVTIGDKDYSNKPPVLSMIGAGVYWALKHGFGLTFQRNQALTVYLLTLILVGGTTAWLVVSFYNALGIYTKIGAQIRIATTIALATGTILTAFSTTLNNHTVTAALLFASCRASWSGGGLRAGIWGALALCIDPVPSLILLPVLAAILHDVGRRRAMFQYFICMCLGAVVFMLCDWLVTGSPLPPKMVPGAVDHSSQFAPGVAGVLLPDTWSYPIQCLFGWHGFFTVSPVLLLAVAGLMKAGKTGRPFGRRWYLWLSAGIGVILIGHVLLVGSFGGWSYGFRYLIPIIPILLFFLPVVLSTRRMWPFAIVLTISSFLALIGAYNPWPPAYEQEANKDPVASLVTNPIGANVSAWMRQYFPAFGFTDRLCATFISADSGKRTEYLYLFYKSKGDDAMAFRILHPSQPGEGENQPPTP